MPSVLLVLRSRILWDFNHLHRSRRSERAAGGLVFDLKERSTGRPNRPCTGTTHSQLRIPVHQQLAHVISIPRSYGTEGSSAWFEESWHKHLGWWGEKQRGDSMLFGLR